MRRRDRLPRILRVPLHIPRRRLCRGGQRRLCAAKCPHQICPRRLRHQMRGRATAAYAAWPAAITGIGRAHKDAAAAVQARDLAIAILLKVGGETMPLGPGMGLKKTNGFGLCDMSGNVWEWCWDAWKSDAYSRENVVDPSVHTSNSNRVGRGGCWESNVRNVRVSNRNNSHASTRSGNVGFRIFRTVS